MFNPCVRRGDRRQGPGTGATRTCRSARRCISGAATGKWSEFSTAGGSSFESEVWADIHDVQDDSQRGAYYAIVRLKLAPGADYGSADQSHRRRPANQSAGRDRGAVLQGPVGGRQPVARARDDRRGDHGRGRDLRRDEHDVCLGFGAHHRNRHAARARLHARARCWRSFLLESLMLASWRRVDRDPAGDADQWILDHLRQLRDLFALWVSISA